MLTSKTAKPSTITEPELDMFYRTFVYLRPYVLPYRKTTRRRVIYRNKSDNRARAIIKSKVSNYLRRGGATIISIYALVHILVGYSNYMCKIALNCFFLIPFCDSFTLPLSLTYYYLFATRPSSY